MDPHKQRFIIYGKQLDRHSNEELEEIQENNK
jgi:hypothetical protein